MQMTECNLFHAQQECFGLEQISDGLCFGLEKNIVDTFFDVQAPVDKIIFCWGVSKSRRLGRHIAALTGSQLIFDNYVRCCRRCFESDGIA